MLLREVHLAARGHDIGFDVFIIAVLHHAQLDIEEAYCERAEFMKSGLGEVNHTAVMDRWQAVIHPDPNTFAISKVGDIYDAIERQRWMGSRHGVHVENLAIGGTVSMVVIPGSFTSLKAVLSPNQVGTRVGAGGEE